ncbi:MAG: ATP-dependent helicase [Deltaproteobacteria bacterium]|nr:ATP-dependent helicase [Deltaproteobacteria bacterium]
MATRSYVLQRPHAAPRFRIDYARELNPEQLAAVEAPPGPCLVIAGAGTGKTRTLIYRLARTLELGTPLEAMLLLTFTNKAAREMVRRVEGLTQGLADPRKLLGGTFHHVAHAVLRTHGAALGLSPGFALLDREDARTVMGEALSDVTGGRPKKRLPRPELIVELASLSANTSRSLEEILAERRPAFLPSAELLARAAACFTERKRRMNLVDFDDLLVFLRQLLLEQPAIRNALRERFRAVFVDEFQDTNRLQGELVDLLAGEGGNVTAVGDDAQCIYGFRGAHFANIRAFPARHPGCRTFTLVRNYRSTPEVLALANASLSFNRDQFERALVPARPSGARPVVVATAHGDEQASFVAQRVLELRDEGVPLGEMAVLYRAHGHALELQLELARRGIPYQVRAGVRFFEQAHIKDVVCHLRLLQNPADELSFKRCVRLWPGVGGAAAHDLWTRLSAHADPLQAFLAGDWKQGFARRALAGAEQCRALFAALDAAGRTVPGELVARVLDGGYRAQLEERFAAAERREEDLAHLSEYAARYPDVGAFLSELSLLGELHGEDVVDGEPPDELLVLATVHQAKGLEWRAVFVIGAVDGQFPLAHASRTADEEEEERRLFYVALTRARDELYVCYPLTSASGERGRSLRQASRFITELPDGEPAPFDRWILDARS